MEYCVERFSEIMVYYIANVSVFLIISSNYSSI